MWLCNAYKFRLHKWFMYTVYTKEKPVWCQNDSFPLFSDIVFMLKG